MSVDAKHKLAVHYAGVWKRARNFVSGPELARTYVRKLPGQTDEQHKTYAGQAYYLPAVARSLDAFTGMVMNPAPSISAPEGLTPYLDDVSYDGEPAARMIGRTVREVLEVGRCAVLVDYPSKEGGADMSVAEAEAAGLRAYARFYRAEDILDWRVEGQGGQRWLTWLKLRETYDLKKDEWTVEQHDQIRVLDIIEDKYRVRLYRKYQPGENAQQPKGGLVPLNGWSQIGEDVYPMAQGKPLDYIPVVVFGPDGLDASEVDQPPMIEMVDIAEAHINDSALHQWALMWVGNPTPVFVNLDLPEGETLRLGSSQGISLREGGSATMLYLPAEGVGAIRQAMEDKRRDMAAVGARLLADETSSQIARDTAIIQRAGEHSVLAQLATTCSDGWRQVLETLALWAGVSGEVGVELNTDFVPQGLTAGELTDYLAAVQAGEMSSRDLFALLQKRGVVRADKTYDEHLDEIEEGAARALEPPPGADGQQDQQAQQDQQQDQAA
jgi:hypothetical protein